MNMTPYLEAMRLARLLATSPNIVGHPNRHHARTFDGRMLYAGSRDGSMAATPGGTWRTIDIDPADLGPVWCDGGDFDRCGACQDHEYVTTEALKAAGAALSSIERADLRDALYSAACLRHALIDAGQEPDTVDELIEFIRAAEQAAGPRIEEELSEESKDLLRTYRGRYASVKRRGLAMLALAGHRYALEAAEAAAIAETPSILLATFD